MFIIDLTLKGSPLALSVQRKESDQAEALYQKILKAMGANNPQALELTCDHQPEKKIGVLSSEISAVQLSEKSGTASSKSPGFWAQVAQ